MSDQRANRASDETILAREKRAFHIAADLREHELDVWTETLRGREYACLKCGRLLVVSTRSDVSSDAEFSGPALRDRCLKSKPW